MEFIKEFKGKYGFLSNFYPAIIKAGWIIYPTVEHYFQAMKTLPHTTINILDHENNIITIEQRLWISLASTPGKARQLGRQLELRPDWEDIKIPVMGWGVDRKFEYPKLAEQLITTFPHMLIEGNYWHDNFWGDCYCGRPSCIEPGQNNLGELLMKVRSNLMKRR